MQRLLQVHGVLLGIDAIERAQRAHDDLARGQRGQQADADLPVETERSDNRHQGMTDAAHDAVLNGRRLSVMERQVG